MSDPVIEAGITIPDDLADKLVDISSLTPNTWNPNRMDSFMRDKLRKALEKDGFIVPVLVRPLPPARKGTTEALWEIVDGEHRYKEALDIGMKRIPIINLGPITDEHAKLITVKANTLRGEFDAVKLAEMVADLSNELGVTAVVESLPYTPERVQAMIDLINVDTSQLTLSTGDDKPSNAPASAEDDEDDESEAQEPDRFKTLDPSGLTFAHVCPRCKFGFND
ncbi:ParB/RepB/Spo0J family partition protein [Azospirillum sp. Sh1]|uniref:ParB/RepB/Spo0J family partition protein n=1 Tax=Azospirillum sp. Sh1 TaxID=2607285 RepID=UPI0011EED631|nr:ParB/RepB/Spo0J family partition protein [Azospirillum sp. Sh1]KAA0573390.1 hypothetical protein FZ029_20650 [Azospirillum sp. Sh1]